MPLLRRVLSLAAALTLAAPAVAAQADGGAQADGAPTPHRRISCPAVGDVSRASGYDLANLTSTQGSCWYESARDLRSGAPKHRVEFTYTKDTSLAQARERVDSWETTVVEPAPALGDGAFTWQATGSVNVYWAVGGGAVGTLGGVNGRAEAIATAALFRPQMEVYTVDGERTINGRTWRTTCEPYSETTRCRTEIWAHTFVTDGDTFRREARWVFNSLTYLWAKRNLWEGNPLATPGTWLSDGQWWRTECDTAATGRGACRTWRLQPTVVVTDGEPQAATAWVFNNQVLFS